MRNGDGAGGEGTLPAAVDLYLDLLKGCLTRELFLDQEMIDVFWWPEGHPIGDFEEVWGILERCGWRLVRPNPEPGLRREGRDFPVFAETMVGRLRLDNLQDLTTRVVLEDIPGDLVETGVWRGGAVILMRAVLAALEDSKRVVWACDSFEGMPDPNPELYPLDATMRADQPGGNFMMKEVLAVSVDQVKENIARYGLLDERVRFVKGWFRDTLADLPVDQISLLRLDGDLYESTIDALQHLEPRVSPGGFVIVDDYSSVEACRKAVDDYRAHHGIVDDIHPVDWTGVWWQKSS